MIGVAFIAVELYLLVWFAIVGFEAFMQRAYGYQSPFNLLDFHHAYLGAGIVALGFPLHSVTGTLLQLLGLVITIDDHIQHLVQTYSEDRDYLSPLHELFAKTLWKVRGVPALTHFLDTRWPYLVLLLGAALFVFRCAP